jgi:y4mF family transcriptional regulator
MVPAGAKSEAKDPDGDHNSVGAFVRGRRKARSLSQAELGELAGVGRRFVVELERNKRTLRMDAVNAVLAVFGKQLGVVDSPRNIDGEV